MSPEFPLEHLPPATLLPHAQNWRVHPPGQRAALAASLAAYGWLEAVIWNRTTGNLLDGHARVEEALQRGEATVPVRVVAVDAAEEREILASVDWLGEQAQVLPEAQAALLGLYREDFGTLPLSFAHLETSAPELPDLTDPFAEHEPEPTGGAWEPAPKAEHKRVAVLVPKGDYPQVQARLTALATHFGAQTLAETVMRTLLEARDHAL
jgi:hypothetical protein